MLFVCKMYITFDRKKKAVTESPCNIFVYLSFNLLLGNIRMSLSDAKKLNLTNNYIKVYTGCTSLLTDHTAYSQLHHDDAICKHSGISS